MSSTSTHSLSVDEAGQVFVDPSAYADDRRFHEACTLLRREDPVHWVEGGERFNPFWAITRHADVLEIEAHPNEFRNDPRAVLVTAEEDAARIAQGDAALRTLIHMDAPDHRVYRSVTSDWFLPKSLARLESRLAELAVESVDLMAARLVDGVGECDFATDIAMRYPLQVILSILGLPEDDYPRMLSLTQELFGSEDPEMSRGQTIEERQAVVVDFFQYFTELTERRRAHPTDDLASAIANARIDGEPLPPMEALSYYVIIATAGHDTTSSSMSGGLHALIENPDQLERLRADPSLIDSAADEMIRWTTPVKHFMRTAMRDYEIRGRTIREGQAVLLSYPSANRDEDVFADPFSFDVGRTPNKHLAFGFGAHFCIGAMLARMELKALYRALVPRLASVELAGEPALVHALFVSGHKRLPIRYTMR